MFQKLKLDPRPSKPPPSSHFAAIKKQSPSPSPTPPPHDPHPEAHGAPAYAAPVALEDDGRPRSGGPGRADDGSVFNRPLGTVSPRHSRSSSIAFSTQITTDSGQKLSMDEPLPEVKTLRELEAEDSGRDSESPLYEDDIDTPPTEAVPITAAPRAHSESRAQLYDPVTGRPLDGQEDRRRAAYRMGRPRHPLLQATVNDLAVQQPDAPAHGANGEALQRHGQPPRGLQAYEANEQVASLTSETTASPTSEEATTPLDESQYLLSPLPTSSPIEFPAPPHSWLNRQHSSSVSLAQRTRSLRSMRSATGGSVRRPSRRSSARSQVGTPSISPASAFLSQWSFKDEHQFSQPEPDDEGQEIGDHSEYIIGRQIGFGGFSVVKEVFTLGASGDKVKRAVKIVRKQVTGKSEADNERLQQDFEREVSVWRFLKHPHILPLLAVYDSPFATFCITRLNVGGTLFDLIRDTRRSKPPGFRTLAPRLARRYAAQLASALRYLHNDVHVVHRDVKLENCLVDLSIPHADTEGGNVLLCDFGMADFITNDNRDSPEPYDAYPPSPPRGTDADERRPAIGPAATSTSVVADQGYCATGTYGGGAGGSLAYAAPELLDASQPIYSPVVDMWAYGVVVHALLVGGLPFSHTFEPRLAMAITKGEWDVEALRQATELWGPESERMELGWQDAAVELVEGCLSMDTVARWNIADVVESTYLAGCHEVVEESMAASWLEE